MSDENNDTDYTTPIDTPFKPTEYETLNEAGEVIGFGTTARYIFDELVEQGHRIRRKVATPQGNNA